MSTELVTTKLRQRAAFMRKAGHNDDADLDEEAADELTALTAKLERESGDLRYAKQALDRETARALKFGKRITALTAKVALLTEALRVARSYVEQAVKDDGGIDNCEIGDRLALERIDAALSEPDKEGML